MQDIANWAGWEWAWALVCVMMVLLGDYRHFGKKRGDDSHISVGSNRIKGLYGFLSMGGRGR